jgi:hypothetical protein
MYPTFFIPNGLLVGLNVFLTYLIWRWKKV